MASSSHILVIDDDQLILNLAVRVLGGLDYQVSTATTAEIGLELPEQNTFDLIILDLVMPAMGGMHFPDRLPTDSEPPIIVMSGERNFPANWRHLIVGQLITSLNRFPAQFWLPELKQN